ncbi:hypothetical protein [Verrucomicrobium sp. BvORR034]|uniref:hypothetical protein n=1 Tax=Verrucomicrobium sp. BvORR034 TaxID=1396418 RepID=UPI000678FB8F|nr:hypothetical protein [Verrucomicrobium sp. BvORR034]
MSEELEQATKLLIEKHGIGTIGIYIRTLIRNDCLAGGACLSIAMSFNNLTNLEQAELDRKLLKRLQGKPRPRGVMLNRMVESFPRTVSEAANPAPKRHSKQITVRTVLGLEEPDVQQMGREIILNLSPEHHTLFLNKAKAAGKSSVAEYFEDELPAFG